MTPCRYLDLVDYLLVAEGVLGADAAVEMAMALHRASVPVALLVAFSPANSSEIPGNVGKVVNYYQSNSAWNHVYTRGSGFHGAIRNINLAGDSRIDHFNIEKIARLHADTIRSIESLGHSCAARP